MAEKCTLRIYLDERWTEKKCKAKITVKMTIKMTVKMMS